jgi:hypothetical protein
MIGLSVSRILCGGGYRNVHSRIRIAELFKMANAEASVEELVMMIERGELRLPEMQRQYVWRSTRVRDLGKSKPLTISK